MAKVKEHTTWDGQKIELEDALELSMGEESEELTKQQRKVIKYFKRKIDKHLKKAKGEQDYRKRLEKCLLELTEIMDIDSSSGDSLTKENIVHETTEEIEKTLEEAFTELKKIL